MKPSGIFQAILSLVLIITVFEGCNNKGDSDVSLRHLIDNMSPDAEIFRWPVNLWQAGTVSGEINVGNVQSVLFNARGSGVITRIRLSAEDRRGTLKFFFDESQSADIEIPSFSAAAPNTPEGFADAASASWLPMPYAVGCRIVYEPAGAESTDTTRTFQIDYRTYNSRVSVETFTPRALASLRKKTALVGQLLIKPESRGDTQRIEGSRVLAPGDPLVVNLPSGTYVVNELSVKVTPLTGVYPQTMRDVIMQTIFDGLQTMRIPLADFSGGGMGARQVKTAMLTADGNGEVVSRWPMPYREEAQLAFINEGISRMRINYSIKLSPVTWNDGRSMYFHASWRETMRSTGDPIILEISGGKGIYKGSALTLYNYGSESDWLRNTEIETTTDGVHLSVAKGLDNYYNASAGASADAHTPFGGMIQVGANNTHGYNSFLRLRFPDDIPFTNSLNIIFREPLPDIDFAAVAYWYGDHKARAINSAAPVFRSRTLPVEIE